MKRFAASAASWILGMVGWWSLHWQERIHRWSGIGPEDDFWKPGGTD